MVCVGGGCTPSHGIICLILAAMITSENTPDDQTVNCSVSWHVEASRCHIQFLLISSAVKLRGNLCGYSNELRATVRSCCQRLRKLWFLFTGVQRGVFLLIYRWSWLHVDASSLAHRVHHKFLTLLQQSAICKLWWSDQNYYCAEYIAEF